MAPRPSPRKTNSPLTFQAAKDQFIPWAIVTMVGYATYNIDKLTISVTNLNTTLTKATTVIDNHEDRLNRQGILIIQQGEKNSIQDAEIAALKATQPKQ